MSMQELTINLPNNPRLLGMSHHHQYIYLCNTVSINIVTWFVTSHRHLIFGRCLMHNKGLGAGLLTIQCIMCKLLNIVSFLMAVDILTTYHKMSSIMEFLVKVFVYKHFNSSTLQNVPAQNLDHSILSKTIRCWVSKESSCHADAKYLV